MYASESFDTIGPMTASVADAAHVLRAISGHPVAQSCDPAVWPAIETLRVGVLLPDSVCSCSVAPEVAAHVEAAVEVLRCLVASVVPATLPTANWLSALIGAEAYSHFAPYAQRSRQAFDPRIRKHLQLDGPPPAADVDELRTALASFRREVKDAFSDFDVVVSPTLPTLPIPISDAEASFALAHCTLPFNVAGLPAISIPCGYSSEGLPIGLQIGSRTCRLASPRGGGGLRGGDSMEPSTPHRVGNDGDRRRRAVTIMGHADAPSFDPHRSPAVSGIRRYR